ncbi:MAG TPA: hypothetical protein VFM93_08510, partial [Candidatus Limnocylindria bacterium]|nr:hypothetical protein [Candidatus Limnocylindria bacterium]
MIRLLPLVAVLALTACQAAGALTGADVDLGARVERVRGHLVAARGDAAAGRWDLAHVHAVHPTEDLPGIDRVLRAKDPGAASSLAARLAVLPTVSYSRDPAATAAALDEAESALATVTAAALGTDAARTLAFRASVVAALVEASAAEYDESFADGGIAVLVEYQDAHAFLARARATWAEIAPDVAASAPAAREEVGAALDALASLMPSLEPPQPAAPPARVRALAASVRSRLAAVGARAPEAAAADLASAAEHLDTAVAALDLGDVPAATA